LRFANSAKAVPHRPDPKMVTILGCCSIVNLCAIVILKTIILWTVKI
jgi:hypothetical protein